MAVNIYQIFTRLFRNDDGKNIANGSIQDNGCSKFNHFDKNAITAIKEMGFTHVWLTGVIRHACTTSYPAYQIEADYAPIVKGKAGSPYAIKDYFDVAPDLAENIPNRMQEFKLMLERFHTHDLKIIIDFVPNHLARQYKSTSKPEGISELGQFDDQSHEFLPTNNFYYLPYQQFTLPDGIQPLEKEQYLEYPAKATGNNVFRSQPDITDWYETIKLNYGVNFKEGAKPYFDPQPPTWYRMYEILKYWAEKGIDGFRVDMADMVPMSFWQWVVPKIKNDFPEIIFVAEAYQPSEYKEYIHKAKFDYLYDKEQFYNTVRSVIEGKNYPGAISQVWKEQEGLEKHLLRFLENHDEQRIASDFFAKEPAKAKAAMVLTATMHKGPLMIYFGQEMGEKGMETEGFSGIDGKTTIFDYWKIESYQNWVNNGKFEADQLDKETIELREWYTELIKLRNRYSIIEKGKFYDLMWVNESLQNNHYLYFRHNHEKILFFAIVFNTPNTQDTDIKVPNHTLEHLGLDSNKTIKLKQVFESPIESYTHREYDHQVIKLKTTEATGYIFEISQ
jgi:glycosidase